MGLLNRNTAQRTELADGLTEFNLGYYGWRVVLAACLGVMAGFGSLFVYTFTVFVKPLSAQFGWNRESVSLGFGLAAITLGVVSPLLGRWIDRFGPRRIILPCMTVYCVAIISLAFLRSELWQFYLTCIVLGLVGNGAAHLAYSRSISTWFQKRLGTALAFVMVGAGLGALILPVVAQAIISRSGWRAAYFSLGCLALLLGLAAELALYLRTWRDSARDCPCFSFWTDVAARPALLRFLDYRRHPFRELDQHEWSDHATFRVADGSRNHARRCGVMRVHDWWFERARQDSVSGWLLDRFFGARVALVVNLITAAGIFLLAHASSFPAGCLAAALIGIGAGGEAAITPYLLTRYFGIRSFSTLYGLTWTFYAAAGAIGPVILGRAFDLTGSYTSLLVVLAVALALAAAMNLFLPKYSSSADHSS